MSALTPEVLMLSFQAHARSITGSVRASNQDAALSSEHVLLVADGMGGHQGGDVASALVAREVEAVTPGLVPASASAELQGALMMARHTMRDVSWFRPGLSGMGSTATVVCLLGDVMSVIHVGDSRAYLLRNDALSLLTKDHTFVQGLVDSGSITPEQALAHPGRHRLTRVVSAEVGLELDVTHVEVRLGDRLLLCSDGLAGPVSDEEILSVLKDGSTVSCTERLLDLALDRGSRDNITAVVADVVESSTSALFVTGSPDTVSLPSV